MLVKVDESEAEGRSSKTLASFPALHGPVGLARTDCTAAQVDWDEVRELVDASFRMIAPRKLIERLDGV